MVFQALLPRCENEVSINCTSDFGIVSSTGEKTSAAFSRYFPEHAQNEYVGDDSLGLPSGVAGSIYSLPQATHDGGEKYYLSVALKGDVTSKGVVNPPSIDIRISPVAIEPSKYFLRSGEKVDAGWAKITDRNTGVVRWGEQGSGFSGDQYCVANSAKENLCAQKYAFPADMKFYVNVRISKSPGGWMHGRISNPDIKITANPNSTSLEFQGFPVAVPVVYKKYQYTEMPDALKKLYDIEKGGYIPSCDQLSSYCAGGRSGPSEDPLNRNVIISPTPWSWDGMEQLKIWLPYVEDKSTALMSFWSVRTLSGDELSGSNNCFSDSKKVTGIVTTNSTQYSAGPPKFNKSEQTLDYQVASPHYGSKGDVFKGSYDLVMRPDVARCVYGFSKAPIRATLSITSADGTPQTATTLIGENKDWVYLSAKNFEFSAPTVRAKLEQDPEPTPTVSPSKISPQGTKSIICQKGKVKKTVKGTNPKCPTGYKKVA